MSKQSSKSNSLQSIFAKKIDRPIEGVIKADDEASLRLELEEYVLTNEVEKRLESFLEAYNNYEGANGVWVSGFFGSGKSHLLKMLALLLENREIDGTTALDLFQPKCGDNGILRGDLKRAVAIPSKSILFNIDQKADVISKTQIDALLSVFVKVFDEMSGYYGKQGHIAQFERDLESRGLYASFKDEYEVISGRPWTAGREQALLESRNIAKAYAQVTGSDEASAVGILDKYRSQHRVSIEDFAEQVHAFIESQPPHFRLNFFVDEVGQYIAENVKLMTNLQTIAESLATRCKGRAWIIVTAQEDMGSVVGEMGQQQGNDFSKIQARFANRMKLTSADVAEVIQKRLLLKNDTGIELLEEVYREQSNNFRTLFDFADGAQSYRNFQDRDHFIYCYPFIPYQFSLFQASIQNLSLHNAFEGKHSSVGERSMLGVFQQVAIQIGTHAMGDLATFDLMFEGIRTALKSQIQKAIIQAENNLDSPYAIRVLKALFLVKYVKEFKSTLRNICVLMMESFDQELKVLKKQTEEALDLLEQQTYIQRNGDLYDYLTDEEKDIEEEIKNTDVENSEVAAELETIIFDQVIRHRKIRFDENGQDYSFSRRLDDRLFGREHELSIHVISPFGEESDNPQMLAAKSMGSPAELFVILPSDDRLITELLMYKRTDRYIRQNVTSTQRDELKRILSDKGFQNQNRLADLKLKLSGLIAKARLSLAGSELEIRGEDAQSRIMKGFPELIIRTYPNLRMLRGISYTEDKVKTILQGQSGTLFGNDATSLTEAEQEMMAFIQSNHRSGIRTTVKSILERFERKPYGWYYAAMLCILAGLCVRGKVEVRSDGSLLDGETLERALLNSHAHGNVTLELQVEFSASQVRSLKQFFEEFFDKPPRSGEAKALGLETGEAFDVLVSQLTSLEVQKENYPFLGALSSILEKLAGLKGKPYAWYLTEISREEDALLDMKEGVLDPIRKFMSGPQKGIYDEARQFLSEHENNLDYLNDDEGNGGLDFQEGDEAPLSSSALRQQLIDPNCFKGGQMQRLKSQISDLLKRVESRINEERRRSLEKLDTLWSRLKSTNEFSSLDKKHQENIQNQFNEVRSRIEGQTLIPVIRDSLRRFEDSDYPAILTRLHEREAVENSASNQPETADTKEEVSKKQKKASPPIPLRSLTVEFNGLWLFEEADVDRYLKSLREAMMMEIKEGKRIQV